MQIFQSNLRRKNQQKFFKKRSPKGGSKKLETILFSQLKKPWWKLFFKFFWKIFTVVFVEKFAFFETLDHHNCKTAWLTSVKFCNMNICINMSNFSQNGGVWRKKYNFMQAQKWPKCQFCWFCSDKVTLNVNISATVWRSELKF